MMGNALWPVALSGFDEFRKPGFGFLHLPCLQVAPRNGDSDQTGQTRASQSLTRNKTTPRKFERVRVNTSYHPASVTSKLSSIGDDSAFESTLLNVLKITVANARTRSHTALTRGAFEPPSTIQRKSITHPQRDPLPAAHPGPWSSPPSSKHRKRRVCSGSRPIPRSGGDAHSFMTFGLCTRNEKCAPAPLPNRALPRCCLRVACGLPQGYPRIYIRRKTAQGQTRSTPRATLPPAEKRGSWARACLGLPAPLLYCCITSIE